MECQYQSNYFCRSLSSPLRQSLCAHCHFKRFTKGQRMYQRYFENTATVLVEGLMVFGENNYENDMFTTSGLACPGNMISQGLMFRDLWSSSVPEREIICLQDCRIAAFDTDFVQNLFSHDVEFIKSVFVNLLEHCADEKVRMLQQTGRHDVYSGVRYVINYCHRHNIPPLTQSQIALICNRSRPSVTVALKEMIQKEPELFSREEVITED